MDDGPKHDVAPSKPDEGARKPRPTGRDVPTRMPLSRRQPVTTEAARPREHDGQPDGDADQSGPAAAPSRGSAPKRRPTAEQRRAGEEERRAAAERGINTRHRTASTRAVADRRTTQRTGTGERPRHSSGERRAASDRAARHGTAERRALSTDDRADASSASRVRPEDLAIDARVPWQVGDLIAGRYEIERPLGGGSMGDVFLGEDRLLKKPVALKVLRPDLAESRDTVHRFLREVALAHSVTHRNVVRIYDTGEERGLPFFTMEVLQGQVLDDLLEGPAGQSLTPTERMPIKKIRAIAFDVLDGMDAAHRAGVVHRDLKPGNVMLTHRGAIVMDFGVAGIDDMLERGKAPLSTSSLRSLVRTEAGTLFGSPAYMAPELWEGQPATVQSDLYAFGVMLYQMLTGRLPYSAKTPAAFVEKLSTTPPPPLRSLRRDVPWNLVRLVRRCMAHDPQERPASASAAANLISPLRGRQRRRFVTAAVGLTAVGLTAVLARATPSWRDLGLSDALAEAELSAAVRDFDVGERAAALRRLDRLATTQPKSAALSFWRSTVLHDLDDPSGRRARCSETMHKGSAAWLELARAACEPTYRLATPAQQALEDGPRSLGPQLLPLAVQLDLIPRLDADPSDTEAFSLGRAVRDRMAETAGLPQPWDLPNRWQLARRDLTAALGPEDATRVPLSGAHPEAETPLLLQRRAIQAVLDGDDATADKLGARLRPVDPTISIRIAMHGGRLDAAWAEIEALGESAHRPSLEAMWCGYALRFDLPARPSRCEDLPDGLTRALWDVREGRPADVGRLDPASAAIVQSFAQVRAGRCDVGDARPPRLRNVSAPFELFAAELTLTAALCPDSASGADPVRARSLDTALGSLSPNDPWLLLARARIDDAHRPAKAEAKRLAASERWAEADTTLPVPARLREALGMPSNARAGAAVAGR